MTIPMLLGKIHRATVTQADLEYVGSITIDRTFLEAAGIREYQKVEIADVDNGARFSTWRGRQRHYLPERCGGPLQCGGGQGHHHGLRRNDAGGGGPA